MHYKSVRRIVTGHTPSGKAVIDSDTRLTPYDPMSPDCSPATTDKLGFTTLWRTESFPAKVDGPWMDLHGTQIPLADSIGTTIRMVDFPPGPGFMHRTLSIDFGIVLSGEIILELDNGVKTILKKDDIVVQPRMLFSMLPAEPVKIGNETLEATMIPPPPVHHNGSPSRSSGS
ncbi:hypothetical protein ACO22_01360 [Paracoccidioides brasiliensis]|uniref:Cupin 2 conserved barrel domain-containing protein n=1 Tax=Paracoccidioides brasiliensis TaxID=121759 RepID=A0A1D2JLR1_PARBR|nr:hypothetical protein ACO22_01360 [Paracoccidioides brasiliensis]